MLTFGWGGNGRRAYILDEIQHLSKDCLRMLLGLLENLPSHVIVIGTTTSTTWADDVDGLYSRWRRFRFQRLDSKAVEGHIRRIAKEAGLCFPRGYRVMSYVHHREHGVSLERNLRDLIDGLPDFVRRLKGAA